MVAPHADIAHAFRRLSFGPFPGQVEELAKKGDGPAAAQQLLRAPASPVVGPALGSDDDERLLTTWWLERMADPGGGLAEKMTWFWHMHFTSGFDKVDEARHLWQQHQLLRRHALGSFREMLREITVDAAMLQYLDGQHSTGDAPNENYAREMLELFTVGRGAFGEADVRSGARALAGWTIDDRGRAAFDPTRAFGGSVRFLGVSKRFDAAAVADTACEHPACAPNIAGKIHRFLVGTDPTPARRTELGATFQKANYQILPVVDAIVDHPTFWAPAARYSRARHAVEWLAPATAVLGRPLEDLDGLWRLGQVPFHPPNVAGWPDVNRWLSPGAAMVRAGLAYELADDTEVDDDPDPTAWALRRAAIFDASPTTRRALDLAGKAVDRRRLRASTLLSLAVCSPEFVLA